MPYLLGTSIGHSNPNLNTEMAKNTRQFNPIFTKNIIGHSNPNKLGIQGHKN